MSTTTTITWTRTAPTTKSGGGKIVSDCGRFTLCQELDAWRGWYLWDDVKAAKASDNYGVALNCATITACKRAAQRLINLGK